MQEYFRFFKRNIFSPLRSFHIMLFKKFLYHKCVCLGKRILATSVSAIFHFFGVICNALFIKQPLHTSLVQI